MNVPLFKRETVDGDGITAFWAWWTGRKDAIAAAIEAGTVVELVDEISRAVKSIDAELAWELGPGVSAKHSFCVSPEGDITRRPITQRWRMAAPPTDATWEYLPARQGGKLMVLETGDVRLDQKDFRIGIQADESRRRLNVALFHPGHAGLPREVQLQSSFLFLDHCLGEDDVERWIGRVDIAETEPAGAVSPAGLRDAVAAMRSATTERTFTLLGAQDAKGNPVIVSAAMSLKKIDHLFHDSHGEVTFPLGAGWPPDQKLLDAVNSGEDALIAALDGTAIYMGHLTQTGRRTLHFVAVDGATAKQRTDAWLGANSGLHGKATWSTDPTWAFRRQWGG